jgi:hypothetical protein
MRSRTAKYTIAAFALVAAGSAQAFGIGVRAGTTGVGADVAWSVAPTLSARLGYSGLKWDHDVTTSSGIRYDGQLKLSNFNALLDFSPLGPFRITGGFIFNDNKFDAVGTTSAGGGSSLNGSVKAGKSAAPYLGVGYGNVSGLGVNFYADLGIMFMGSPTANVTANCGTLVGAACTNLQAQAAAERARLEDELKNFKYYPVFNIGLTVGF